MLVSHPPIPSIPAEAVSAARGACNLKDIYIAIGDQIDTLMVDIDLFQFVEPLEMSTDFITRLSLITFFQFAETLTDRQAVEAVYSRTDWKYALHLPLGYPGLDDHTLCKFRSAIWHCPAGLQTFQILANRLATIGLIEGKENQRIHSAQILTSVCTLSRLEWVADAMCLALEVLAADHPGLLREIALPHWYERYGRRHSSLQMPATRMEQEELAQRIGEDASYLLATMGNEQKAHRASIPEMRNLQQVVSRQYTGQVGKTQWRSCCISYE